jgi:hypothetical protein
LFNGADSCLDVTASNFLTINERRIEENMNGSGRSLFQDTTLEIAQRDRGIPRKTLISIAGVPAENRTKYLPNKSLELTATLTCFVVDNS